jgi:hypothetical protein
METDSSASTPLIDPVAAGMHVEVELVSQSGETERLAFTLVPDDQADFAAGFLGLGTPLAKTILGHVAGSTLPYPVADIRAVRIVAVVAHGATPTEDVAARREASRQEAVNKSEFINAMIFASAVDTKWGDYDVDSLDPATWAPKK